LPRVGNNLQETLFRFFWAKNEAKNCEFPRLRNRGYSRWRADSWLAALAAPVFPNNLIQALSKKGVKNITAISNNCGTREGELGVMFKNDSEACDLLVPRPARELFSGAFCQGGSHLRTGAPGNLVTNACAPPLLACWVSTPRWRWNGSRHREGRTRSRRQAMHLGIADPCGLRPDQGAKGR